MDGGTWVALVLGVGGAAWAITQFFMTRKDTRERDERGRLDAQASTQQERDLELERRWVQEKRLIYVRAQATLTDLLDAETDMLTRPVGSTERGAAIDADSAAWMRMNDVHAELDLLAPDTVRDAVFAADESLAEIGGTVFFDGVPMHPDPIGDATEACRAALNAMRADLGIGPVREWRTPSEG
ncbi:MAG: hypothetical protein BGO38_09865 [Cellulomonas sp. 73-145]|uniref:hypothetical protein n=1 Tax=Cellulomonas sp. 73-145 TaxID=1895739 RepID=UPI000927A4F1|nr:hypothetical protein [Cellulomonas sp. 73-145]MBN9328314.1 hypothetical protein [Cellulomonas sp.]OJV61004.1 MAG: hypothetical protein BGO38_09865 [Cellulomonas sp. 73-145]